jgi:hypothetical protein
MALFKQLYSYKYMDSAKSKNYKKINKPTNKSKKNKTVRRKFKIPKKFMKGLKNITRKITKKSSSKSNLCSICLEEMTKINIVVLPFPCQHKFHFTCIFKELTKTNGQGTCPLCRAQVVPAPTTTNPESEDDSSMARSIVSNLPAYQTNDGHTLYYDQDGRYGESDVFYLDDGTLIDSTYEELLINGTIQDDAALDEFMGNIFDSNITDLPTVRTVVGNRETLYHDVYGRFGERGNLYHADGAPVDLSYDEMVDQGFI